MFYDVEMKRYSDHINAVAYAKEKEAKNKTKGIGIGLRRAARNMLANGYSVDEVIRVTNLSRKQITALKRA